MEGGEGAGPRRGPGRPPNARFDFDPRHPLYLTHVQVLRSDPRVPIISGRCPPLPGVQPPADAPQDVLDDWQQYADLVGGFYLVMMVCVESVCVHAPGGGLLGVLV